MREVAIIGVGIHKFGRFDSETWVEIGREAANMALNDADIPYHKIEAAYCGRVYLPACTGNRILNTLGRTGIPIIDVEAACASGAASLRQAYLAVASGAYDYAMALGVEKMPRGFMQPSAIYEDWQIQMGLSTNPSYWAMRARRYMAIYGLGDEDIAKVAFKNHKNSTLNPYAMYQQEFSMEDILGSRLVCSPIRLLEVCSPNEGAAAVVLCPVDMARRHSSRAVKIAACEHRISLYAGIFSTPSHQTSAKVNNPSPTTTAAQAAYDKAGLGPGDLDLAEVQDTDAFCEIEAYEELGFCGKGQAQKIIRDHVAEPTGSLPVNISGGLICKGEPVGASHLGQVVEVTWQLRGDAGPRQLQSPKVGLCHVIGAGGNSAVTILTR